MLHIYDLKTEYRKNPYGIDAKNPRFSWKIKSDGRGVVQEAYRIIVVSGFQILWESGWVYSKQSQRVRYDGIPLGSAMEAKWLVEIIAKDENGKTEKALSERAYFTMGLSGADDWKCRWIEPKGDFDINSPQPSPM